ncbi:mitochondrial carrier domain-containing protein [Tirmania nivea]|nr:mitochondrial carrier domain-containing protein [Tirmania nivea]
MSFYNSDLDAFTIYQQQHDLDHHELHRLHHPPQRHHHLPHIPHTHLLHASDLNNLSPSEEALEVAMPALGHAVSGSIGSAIANLAVYPLDVVVKRLQVQRALSRRPETKIERDKRLEREKLERDKEEELLAFSINGDSDGDERDRISRKWRSEKEKKDRREKGKGIVFGSEGITSGRPLGAYGVDRSQRGGKLRVDTTVAYAGLGTYGAGGAGDAGSLADKVRQELLEDKAHGNLLSSDYDTTTHDEHPDSREYDRPLNGIPEETEFEKRPRFKPMKGYEDLEGEYEEGDEVEEDENYKGVADAFGKIFEKEGVKGFYTGVVEDTLSTTVNGLWYFATYSFLRHQRLKQFPPNTTTLPVFEELSVGILAGAISKFFTTPIANVVTRKQTAVFHAKEYKRDPKDDPDRKNRHGKWCAHKHIHKFKKPTTVSIIQDIYGEHGASGFWAGYKPSLLLTLNPAITFLLYELLKKGLPKHQRGHQSKTQTFLLGALAKAVASTLTYPLAVVKTRSMISSRKKMERNIKKNKKRASTDSASSSNSDSSFNSSSDSSSDSEIKSDAELKKFRLKYKKKYRKKYGKFRHGLGDGNLGMTAIAKEIYKTDGLKGFYVGLWAEVLKGFFANGISMLIKETIFHTFTSMYLLVLRARNRTDDKSFTGTIAAIGHELHEILNSKHQHLVDCADGVIERGKEQWHIGREKIVRGITGGASGATVGFRHNNLPGGSEGDIITKTTTTTITEEIRHPGAKGMRDLNDNGNATVNVAPGQFQSQSQLERSNPTAGADLIKRKIQLRDAGRERIHEGTIHDGTQKLGHNRSASHNTIDRINNTTITTSNIAAPPVISGVAAADKIAVPSIPTHTRVANWLEHNEKEGLEGLGLGAANPPPVPSTPPLVSVKHPSPVPLHLRTPVNTPFSPHGKGSLVENVNMSSGPGSGKLNGGMRTGTFDVSKSRNIMREVVSEGNGVRMEKEVVRDHVDWEEDDKEWMRRR